MTNQPSTATEPFLKALREMSPLVSEQRTRFDKERQLSDEVFAALANAGLFRLWLPRELGGPELTPVQFMQVVEAAAELDGAIGWLVGNGGGMSRTGGYLAQETAKEWFGDKRAFITSSTGAVGRAVPAKGGYRITGRWPFGSGSSHATHFMVLVSQDDKDQARFPPFCAYVERKQVKLHDTWHVSGLRGTASCDFEIADVFVPVESTHAFMAPAATQPGPLYRIPSMTIFPVTVAVVPLGIALGVLSMFKGLAGATTRLGTNAALRDREVIQVTLGRAEALYHAAHAFLAQSLAELFAAFSSGAGADDPLRAKCRLSYSFAAESALKIGEMLSSALGAKAIFEDCPIERAIRDINAAAKHIAMSPNNYAIAGRTSLGLDPFGKRP